MRLNNAIVFKIVIVTALFFSVLVLLEGQTATAPAIGDGSQENPYRIANLENLYWIAATDAVVPNPDRTVRWSSHYIQTANIDASETEEWFDGQGWIPIGIYIEYDNPDNLPYTGYYDGRNYTVDSFHINRPNTDDIGLFGSTEESTIENLGVTNVSIAGREYVGALLGSQHKATIKNCYATGYVSGEEVVGGLIGCQSYYSIVSDSYSTCNVSGKNTVGGLVGFHKGSIINNSYSTGIVKGEAGSVGGLVGNKMHSTINDSYSTGNVSGTSTVGGLVGGTVQESKINNSYSTSNVSGTNNVGGLVGRQDYACKTINSYSTGNVSGNDNVGGLIGIQNEATISSSFSMSSVTGVDRVGGLVGSQYRGSRTSNSYSTGDVSGTIIIGGLVGSQTEYCTISNSYSTGRVIGSHTVGGLVGSQFESTTQNSYWDVESSRVDTSAGGEGRTTEQMTYPHTDNTYVNWDFEEIWKADEDHSVNSGYPYLQGFPTVSVEDDIVIDAPTKTLITNFPNPFNPETTIQFYITEESNATLAIFNVKGQLVKRLHCGLIQAGEHRLIWNGKDDNGRDVGSGVYFYRLTTGNYDKVNKMVLMK